jgi:hypothetical protein
VEPLRLETPAALFQRPAGPRDPARHRAGLIALALAFALPAARAQDEDPVARFNQLEARLLGARSVLVEGDLHAGAPLDADLHGRTLVASGNRLVATWSGALHGKAIDLRVQSDGRVLSVRNGADETREPAAPESNRAELTGLLRMGLLHNLLRAAGLQGPDHAGGASDHWVRLEYFHLVHVLAQPGTAVLSFDVLAEGRPATTARLWLDAASGLPSRREDSVPSEGGAASVVENYARFVVE